MLLAVLFVLLGSSSLWLAGASQSRSLGAVPVPVSIERERLLRAREALLAHAALYAWTYGPVGAGPGHLPCPDTDASTDLPGMRPRAGPNPPCAARPSVSGALPLHVTVGPLRSAIDPLGAFAPALAYRVAAEVVNNPQGRHVDGALSLSEVFRIDDRLEVRPSGSSSLVMDSTALLRPVERAVAAWAVEQLSRLPPGTVRALCRGAGPCRLQAVLAASDALLETVSRTGHWFVRNGWDDDLVLQIDAGCRTAAIRCRWSLDDGARRAARAASADALPPIRLLLLPSAAHRP